ncbi:MAG: hypothetical protein Q7T57_03120 [Dehalococcoidales bacterium]|nr:hypothetical protein [Dehalococcoidales bacterium]
MEKPKVGSPFIDIDEWRDVPRRHRYVHGGFEDTHTRFSFYFPPKELYKGRFFQYLEGSTGGNEHMLYQRQAVITWPFHVALEELGGYLVESNQAHFAYEGMGATADWELFGASAESALYSKKLAAEMYGQAPRHGYIWGPSGGGFRTMMCIENRPDVWDGASPHVTGAGIAPSYSAAGFAWLHLHSKIPEIVDAMEPGGSGDPFANLSHDQREALAILYRSGYPRSALSQFWSFSPWLWFFIGTMYSDPDYYQKFWNAPGYLGHDDPHRIAPFLIDKKTRVRRVVDAKQIAGYEYTFLVSGVPSDTASNGVELEEHFAEPEALFGASLTFTSGKAKGRTVIVSLVDKKGTLGTMAQVVPELFRGVEEGDEVIVNNRNFIAWCHSFMHGLPLALVITEDPQTGRKQYLQGYEGLRALAIDDRPLFPQHPKLMQATTGHAVQTGRFKGKMIHVNATHDANGWPNFCASYKKLVEAAVGNKISDSYRLWWVENAPHGSPAVFGPSISPLKDPGIWTSRLVDYDGVTAQALRDLTKWVEEGTPPPADTMYRMSGDGDIKLEQDPQKRGGVQPVAHATVNGSTRAEVKVGETVHFIGKAAQPSGTGVIVAAEWDFLGTGAFILQNIPNNKSEVMVESLHIYDKPGTYFASFRVGSSRAANGPKPYARNNARVRVIVTT